MTARTVEEVRRISGLAARQSGREIHRVLLEMPNRELRRRTRQPWNTVVTRCWQRFSVPFPAAPLSSHQLSGPLCVACWSDQLPVSEVAA